VSSGIYGTVFYTLTGFHGAHVFGGVIAIAVMFFRGMAGQFSARHHAAIEGVSWYWHFVDVVWIGLVTTIYILPLLGA
jgi:cytochrome c oxidase subunit 3